MGSMGSALCRRGSSGSVVAQMKLAALALCLGASVIAKDEPLKPYLPKERCQALSNKAVNSETSSRERELVELACAMGYAAGFGDALTWRGK